ncbi:uncharacterized protein LOC144164783 [Haemaphysalis longicornis]
MQTWLLEFPGPSLDDAADLSLAPRKVEAVLKAPKPQSKKGLQSYLGLPFHLLIRDGQQWAWKKGQDLAFQQSEELATKAPVPVQFDPAKPLVLTVEASPYGVGAVLAHRK